MNTHTNLGRRIAAALGAAALGLVGLAGVATAADDTTPVTGAGNINPNTSTSLTIHKYDGNPGGAGNGSEITDTDALGNALAGVTFDITPVTSKSGELIDLTTEAGWKLIDGIKVTDVTEANGYAFGSAVEAETDTSGKVTEALPKGLYLVTETGYGDNTIKTPVEPFLVTLPLPQGNGGWLYDVHVYPKNAVDTNVPTKTVFDPTDGVAIGSIVPWTITAPVQPDKPGAITSFKIEDKLDSRLSYDSLTIANFVAGTDYTVSNASNVVTIEFTAAGLAQLAAGDVVTVVLNTKVVDLGDGVIPNEATVFTNDNDGHTTSKPDEPGTNPTTNWGPLEVLKYAEGDEGKVLAGAEFTVYTDEGATTSVGTFTTGSDGKGSIVLWVGNDDDKTETYYLKETKAPAGYILSNDIHEVEVKAGTMESVTLQKISNKQQDHPNLPLTGANGQMLALIGGGALVLLAGGTALVARKRSHQD